MKFFFLNLNLYITLFCLLIVELKPEPFFDEASSNNSKSTNNTEVRVEKKWAIYVYIAADNDLHYFAWNNIKQLAKGANENVHIVVQLNEPGKNKKTQLYYIEKDKAKLLNKENQAKLDSGDPQTLVDFCTFSMQNYPAEKYILILSNHGCGIIDKSAARLINPSEFFHLNPSNLMLELDRNIEFLNFLEKSNRFKNSYSKGVCFDETYQTYFTNQKLEYALKTVCENAKKTLNKSEFKFSILGIDACLMQMYEIADITKHFANIMIASQEVELGPGWRYDKLLSIFKNNNLDSLEIARHVVKMYEETYSGITNDFTLSAINLEGIDELGLNINEVSENLIELIKNQLNNSVKNIIKLSKTGIAFEEPSYIDLISFYLNILKNIDTATLKEDAEKIRLSLKTSIKSGIKILDNIIIKTVTGSNIQFAKGLSIYFPEKKIHTSYKKTSFAQQNQWFNLLTHYFIQ